MTTYFTDVFLNKSYIYLQFDISVNDLREIPLTHLTSDQKTAVKISSRCKILRFNLQQKLCFVVWKVFSVFNVVDGIELQLIEKGS